MKKIAKAIGAVLLLVVSPFLILAPVGAVYVLIQWIGGMSLKEGTDAFLALIYDLKPYFPYLTSIPLVAIAVTLGVRRLRIGKR